MSFIASPQFADDQILSAAGHLDALARNIEYLHSFAHHWQGVRTAYYFGDGYRGDEEEKHIDTRDEDGSNFLLYERAFRHKENTLRVNFDAVNLSDTDTPFTFRFYDEDEIEKEIVRDFNSGDTYTEFDVDNDIALGLSRNDFYRMEIWVDFDGNYLNDKLEFKEAFETDTSASFGFETMQSFASGTTPTAAHWQQLSDNTDRLHNALVVPQGAFIGTYREIKEETADPPNTRYRSHGYFTGRNQYLFYDLSSGNHSDQKYIQINIDGVLRVTITCPTGFDIEDDEKRFSGTIDLWALGITTGDHEVEIYSDANVKVHQLFEMPADSSADLKENRLLNHAFSINGDTTVFANWNDGNLTGGNTLTADDENWKHLGQSAKLVKLGATDPYVQQAVGVTEGDDYWLEFYYRTGDSGAVVRVLESDLTLIEEYELDSNTNVWTSYRALFTNPAGNNSVLVQILMSETGTVNYDNVWLWEKQAAGDYERMPDFQHGNLVTGDVDVKIIRDNIQWLIDRLTGFPYRNYGSGRWYRQYRRTGAEFKHNGGQTYPLTLVRSRRFLYYYTIPIPEDDNEYSDEQPQLVFTAVGEEKTHSLDSDEDDPKWHRLDLDSVTGLWPSTHYEIRGVEFAIEDDELY